MSIIPRRAGEVRRIVSAAVIALLAAVLAAASVSAHEHREVGDYSLTVGFMAEPALVNEPNGLSLAVSKGGHAEGESDEGEEHAGTAVEGLQDTLEAEIVFGGETKPLELRPVFNEPGHYTADIFPTAEGAYSFHVFGEIEGNPVDETFTAGPETFSEVTSINAISFPAPSGATGSDAVVTSDARDTADAARTLAIVGLVAGVLGLGLGVAALTMASRLRAASATVRRTSAEPGD